MPKLLNDMGLGLTRTASGELACFLISGDVNCVFKSEQLQSTTAEFPCIAEVDNTS